VELFDEKHMQQVDYLIACRLCILVVWSEPEVGQGKLTDELVNRRVGVVLEPDSRDGPDVRFEPTE